MKATRTFTNQEISRMLKNIAAAYTVLNKNRFRILAYEEAATAVEHATSELKDLWDDNKLNSLSGIGPTIAGHLDELFKSGKVKSWDNTLGLVPKAMFALLELPNVGAKTAYKLVTHLSISESSNAIDQLKKNAIEHKISSLDGFGERSEAEILESIEQYSKGEVKKNRMVLPIASTIAGEIAAYLKENLFTQKVEVLGSLRRKVSTIGDIDLAVATEKSKEIIEYFTQYPKIRRIIEKGPTGASVLLNTGQQCDMRIADPKIWGSMLQYFTGSKRHNICLREYALKKGFSLSEYGIKSLKSLKVQEFDTEDKLYQFLGMEWMAPEIREDCGEIEASIKHKLPKLVEITEIKGDLHMHSNYDRQTSHDPGLNSASEMREAGEKLGYEYIGISNHNPSQSKHTPEQIIAKLNKQKIDIGKLNNLGKTKIINLLEVDILPSGELPVFQEGLNQLDACLVSIHSSFRMDRESMTKRVLKGLSNPKAKIFAHPTGRLLEQREGYELNWDEVFRFCLENDKALEINSYPSRLDLPDALVRDAVKRGVKLSLGTDSHNKDGLALMPFGVSVARRGWATSSDIINTWGYNKIITWMRKE